MWRTVSIAIWLGSGAVVWGEEPFTVSSSVEAGWTSNALESQGGSPSYFVEHDHEISLSGSFGPLSLRGALRFDQTRFAATDVEDDTSIAGGVEAAFVIDETMVLRTGYAITQDWTGEGLAVGDALLGLAGETQSHEAFAEFTVVGRDQQVTVAVRRDWRFPGDTMVSGLPIALPPVRLDPQVAVTDIEVNWEKAVSGTFAVLGRLGSVFSSVPETDQLDYARLPAAAAVVAGGGRWKSQALTVQMLGGATAVWPLVEPGLRQVLPYLTAQAELALSDRFTVGATLAQRVDVDDPTDPVASVQQEGELSGRYRMTDSLALVVGFSRSDEAGLFDPSQTRRQLSAKAAIDLSLPETEARMSLSALHKWVDEPAGAYEVTRLTVALSALF